MTEINYQEIAKAVYQELFRQNLIKNGNDDYKNTEMILYSYGKLKESIKDRLDQIEELKKYGINKSSSYGDKVDSSTDNKSEYELINNYIDNIEKSILKTKLSIKTIDRIIGKFNDDKYIDVIKMKYGLDNCDVATIQDISEILEMSISTVSKHRSRLINEMKVFFFPNDQLLCYAMNNVNKIEKGVK